MGAEYNTMMDAIEQAANNVLGDEMGTLTNTFALPLLSKLLGLDSSPTFQTYLTNSGTSAGMQRTILRGQMAEDAARVVRRMKERQRFNAFKELAPKFLPKDATPDAVNRKAWGMQANPFLSMAYDAADPVGFADVSANLTTTFENMVRPALLYDEGKQGMSANAKASYIVENLFSDANGNMKFDRKDYGGFTMGAASKIGAYISATSDILKSAGNGIQIEQLDKAVTEFQSKIQDFSKAITPLRDLFGDDVEAIINTVESMSGVSARHMSTGELSRVSVKLADSASTGMFTLQQLSAITPMVNQQLSALGVDDYVMRSQGMDISTRTATVLSDVNRVPGGMTDASYKHFAGNMAVKTAVSKGAAAINNAYAAWREKRGDKGGTVEDFRKEMNARLSGSNPMTVEEAIKDLAGVSSLTELDAYGLTVESSQAAADNLGADYALTGQKGVIKDKLISALTFDQGGKLAKAGITSNDVSGELARYEEFLKQHPEAATMTLEEFSKLKDEKGEPLDKKLVTMHGFMMQNSEGREYMAMTTMEESLKKQRGMEKTLGDMRTFAETVQSTGTMADSFGTFIQDVLSGNTTIEKYIKDNADSQLAMAIGTPAVQDQLTRLTQQMQDEHIDPKAGVDLIKTIYGDKTKRSSLILADALNNVNGKDSLTIEQITALANVEDQDSLNAAWQALIGSGMSQDDAMTRLANDAVAGKDVLNDTIALSRLTKSSDTEVQELAKKALSGDDAAVKALKDKKVFMSSDELEALKNGRDEKGNLSKEATAALAEYEAKYGTTEYTRLSAKDSKATEKQRKAAYDEVVKAIAADKTGDQSYNHAKAQGNVMKDMIEKLIGSITELVDNMKKFFNKEDNKPEV